MSYPASFNNCVGKMLSVTGIGLMTAGAAGIGFSADQSIHGQNAYWVSQDVEKTIGNPALTIASAGALVVGAVMFGIGWCCVEGRHSVVVPRSEIQERTLSHSDDDHVPIDVNEPLSGPAAGGIELDDNKNEDYEVDSFIMSAIDIDNGGQGELFIQHSQLSGQDGAPISEVESLLGKPSVRGALRDLTPENIPYASTRERELLYIATSGLVDGDIHTPNSAEQRATVVAPLFGESQSQAQRIALLRAANEIRDQLLQETGVVTFHPTRKNPEKS